MNSQQNFPFREITGLMNVGRTPVAICASRDMKQWEWKGVCEWLMDLK
jgi:hypothetical protein